MMATEYEHTEEKPQTANEPLAIYGGNVGVAIDYDKVSAMTNTLIKLSKKLGITLKEVALKMTKKSLFRDFYEMCSPQSGLTQRQTVNRLYKKMLE